MKVQKTFGLGLSYPGKVILQIYIYIQESLLFNTFPVAPSFHFNCEWTHEPKRVGYIWTHPGLSNYTGHWLWSDNTVVDYTNWADVNDYEDDDEEFAWKADCASISTKTKKWKKQHCDYSALSFICKTAKGTYCEISK